MATTIRRKYKQVERQQLIQESESDTDSDYEDSHSTSSSGSEQESDKTVSDSNIINVTDDEETNIERISPEKRRPPSKITRPRTSWIWKFFKETEDKLN